MSHWKTLFDPNDGEPYGVVCHCRRDLDHDGNGNPFPDNGTHGGGEHDEAPPTTGPRVSTP